MSDSAKDGGFMPATMDANTIYIGTRKYVAADTIPQWRPIIEYDPETMFGCVFYGRADGETRIWAHTIRKPSHFMQLTPPERRHD